MSRRFGRNRRRRAREEIAALQTRNTQLEEAHVLDRICSSGLSEKLQKAQEEITRAKAILGRYCVAFMPEHRKMETGFMDVIREAASPRPWGFSPIDSDPISAAVVAFGPIALDVIAARMREDPIRNEMHFSVEFRDGRHGYAITKHALLLMDHPDAVRILTDSLARSLVAHEQRRTYKP
jgi:hypothetical protein